MPRDFLATSNHLATTDILIGYWPTINAFFSERYLSIKKIELDFWGATDPLGTFVYGFFDVIPAWFTIRDYIRQGSAEVPIQLYDEADLFTGSKFLSLFSTIFYPSPQLIKIVKQGFREEIRIVGTIREKWSFESTDNWTMGVDAGTWLFFHLQGLDETVRTVVKVWGEELKFEEHSTRRSRLALLSKERGRI